MRAKPTAHRRWLVKMARAADKERLRRARAALKQARELKRSSKQRAREACKNARLQVRDWAKAERVRVREDIVRLRLEVKNAIAGRRELARTTCSTGRLSAIETGNAQVKTARAELDTLREQARLQRIWGGSAKGKGPTGSARAREVRQESDDEVRGNLAGDELYVWERVKAKIKPRDRMTRLEAFQHWMHEHSGEVSRLLEQQYASDVSRLEREEKAAREAMKPKSYAQASESELNARVAHVTSLPPPPRLPSITPTYRPGERPTGKGIRLEAQRLKRNAEREKLQKLVMESGGFATGKGAAAPPRGVPTLTAAEIKALDADLSSRMRPKVEEHVLAKRKVRKAPPAANSVPLKWKKVGPGAYTAYTTKDGTRLYYQGLLGVARLEQKFRDGWRAHLGSLNSVQDFVTIASGPTMADVQAKLEAYVGSTDYAVTHTPNARLSVVPF